jgi:hypothetical protein
MTVVNRLLGALLVLSGMASSAAGQDKPYFIALPVVYYTPETRLAFGAAGAYNFSLDKGSRDTRPSSVGFILIYTQNDQIQVEMKPEIYLPGDAYATEGKLKYELMPQDFYGVGPTVPATPVEKFTPRTFVAAVSVRKRLMNRLFVGVQYELDHTAIVEVEPGGQVGSGSVTGSQGGVVSGLGAMLTVDSRDNIQFPRRGRHAIVSFDGYASTFGSDYGYNRTTVDYRSYWPVGEGGVLALQAYVEAMTGTVPFYRLARLGGQNMMRGYYHGQYRDKALVALQGEYRAHVWKRIGAAAFAGLGEVCGGITTCSARNVLPSVGGGFRFQLDKRGGMNFRADLAWGRGSHGVYFTVQEAF